MSNNYYKVYISILICFTCINVLIFSGSCQRIIGGKPVKEGEIPYQVSLRRYNSNSHYCGGTIITSKHILTAAHCLYYSWGGIFSPSVVSVVAGQIYIPITNESIYRKAFKVISHENYNSTTMANDIGIIELNEELPVDTTFINTVSLNDKSKNSGKCIVSGWGVTKYESLSISSRLLAAEVDIVEFIKCKEIYALEDLEIWDGMMCAGNSNGETDACQGDSGGPLVCSGVLTGVISTGIGCADPDFPGIYTDVSKYLSWIKDKVGNQSDVKENKTLERNKDAGNNDGDANYNSTTSFSNIKVEAQDDESKTTHFSEVVSITKENSYNVTTTTPYSIVPESTFSVNNYVNTAQIGTSTYDNINLTLSILDTPINNYSVNQLIISTTETSTYLIPTDTMKSLNNISNTVYLNNNTVTSFSTTKSSNKIESNDFNEYSETSTNVEVSSNTDKTHSGVKIKNNSNFLYVLLFLCNLKIILTSSHILQL